MKTTQALAIPLMIAAAFVLAAIAAARVGRRDGLHPDPEVKKPSSPVNSSKQPRVLNEINYESVTRGKLN